MKHDYSKAYLYLQHVTGVLEGLTCNPYPVFLMIISSTFLFYSCACAQGLLIKYAINDKMCE